MHILEHQTVIVDEHLSISIAPSSYNPQSNVQTAELGRDMFRKYNNAELVRAVRAKHFRYERVPKATLTVPPRTHMIYVP